MRELVEVLAAVAAGLPRQHYGFYRLETLLFHAVFFLSPLLLAYSFFFFFFLLGFREQRGSPEPSPPPHPGLSQEVARHCIIQARLLSYRTG